MGSRVAIRRVSVVDATLIVIRCNPQIDNLYMAGGSVFPTNGYANPTLTIVAMALRLAARVNEVLA